LGEGALSRRSIVSVSLILVALGLTLAVATLMSVSTPSSTAGELSLTADGRAVSGEVSAKLKKKYNSWVQFHGTHGLPPMAIHDTTTNTVMCVSPKSGSSSFYEWLFTVSTNGYAWSSCTEQKPYFNYPQAIRSCWQNGSSDADPRPRVHRLNIKSPRTRGPAMMSREEQEAVVADPDVFWFAIVRDPIERAISAWKSKLACDGW
jgi:hypothetical protein